MRIIAAWTLAILLTALLGSTPAKAQTGSAPYYQAPAGQPMYQPPIVTDPGTVAPSVLPPQQGYEPAYSGGGHSGGYGDGCECGDGGCRGCGPFRGGPRGLILGDGLGALGRGGDGLLGRVSTFDRDRPYGAGPCCHPRWFDIDAEFMYLAREEVTQRIDFGTRQINQGIVPFGTNDLQFEEEPGFRITGQWLAGPGTNFEASYFGTFHWSTFAQIDGIGTVNSPLFPQTNGANQQSIGYSSEFNSGELNIRRRWVSPNCRAHSSLLMGARYVNVSDRFRFGALGTNSNFFYNVDTNNNLVGFQLGGDLNFCVVPRLKFGMEWKTGIYGNDARQTTQIASTALPDEVRELASETSVAFVGEAGAFYLFQVNPHFTLRGGYQVVLVEGVALAPNNVNPDPDFGNRQVLLSDGSQVFLHGFTAGFEFTW
jgi:hypothetical protein